MKENNKHLHVALILAGGSGTRVGADRPKQFIEILGKPVIYYTLEAFQTHPDIDAIEVVCIASYIDKFRRFIKDYGFTKVKWIVPGGEDFQHSVINGVNELKSYLSPDDFVLIHYGASPCVSADIIADAVKVAEEKGNGISMLPVYQLIGTRDGDHSEKWIDRDKVAQLLCPQCFKFSMLIEAYEKGEKTGLINEVEPHTTSLMYRLGYKLYFSKGNQQNIKVTEASDLQIVKGYILAREEGK